MLQATEGNDARIQDLSAEVSRLKQEISQADREERDAISQVHNEMFQKLLDLEFEYECEIEELEEKSQNKDYIIKSYEEQIGLIQILSGHSIDELIPKQLSHSSKDKFNRFFYGYIRENYDNELPSDIVETIVDYYPIFSDKQTDEISSDLRMYSEIALGDEDDVIFEEDDPIFI